MFLTSIKPFIALQFLVWQLKIKCFPANRQAIIRSDAGAGSIHKTQYQDMAEVIKRVDLIATFARMRVGETVEIGLHDATESNVRTAASRYSKDKKVELKVSALLGSGSTKVTRTA